MNKVYQIIKKQYSYLVINTLNGYCLIDTESKAEAERECEYYNELEALSLDI